jgi:DNA helicase MCM8
MTNQDGVRVAGFDKEGMMQQYSSLTQKIKIQCDRIPENEIIPSHLLKKYISYAKHTVFPQLSMEACEVLKDFYISLRENACNNSNTIPITSRCLDSLIRLSQARAKLELRTIVTREDTIDIVKLV